MGRGESCFKATKDSFDRVLGPRRGLSVGDSLASENPSETALAAVEDIETRLASGDESLALEVLNRWPAQVEERPLLARTADSLAEMRIANQINQEKVSLRQLASDLDVVPQWAETLVEKDGLIHLWPGGSGDDSLEVEVDARAVCGEPLRGSFRAERGAWVARTNSHCLYCRGEEHLQECSEEVDYDVFDSDIDRDRVEGASSALRFAIGNQLTERGQLEQGQLDLFADEALAHANYGALARQAERSDTLILTRLFPDIDSPEPQRPLHWYNHLRAAGESSARSAERKQLLRERIAPLLEK